MSEEGAKKTSEKNMGRFKSWGSLIDPFYLNPGNVFFQFWGEGKYKI